MQIVHVDSVDNVTSEAKEPLTLADEMASFEYIDELAASTVTSYSSFSDFGKNYTIIMYFLFKETTLQIVSRDFTRSSDILTEFTKEFVYMFVYF